jgi:hypothetical protein
MKRPWLTIHSMDPSLWERTTQWPEMLEWLPEDWRDRILSTQGLPPGWREALKVMPDGWVEVMNQIQATGGTIWAERIKFTDWPEGLQPGGWAQRLHLLDALPDDVAEVLQSLPRGWIKTIADVS